jgi:NADPH:quinone reductase-like Zn-dependent oxidoreductase
MSRNTYYCFCIGGNNMPLAKTMRAFVLTGHGDMDKLVFHDNWPVPKPEQGEVLIKVHACGLNNTDVNTRTAWYSKAVNENTTGGAFDSADDEDATWGGAPITFPRIQGADVAGSVVAVGDGADPALIGKRVLVDTWLRDWDDPLNMNKCGYFGSECDGGFADYTKVDQRNVHPLECDLSDAELATFATSSITAENMLNHANVGEGDTVLIPGASGGVGSALIQLANRRGATTIAMASQDKHAQLANTSPAAILPRSPTNLKAALKQAIGQDTVSVVADVVGGSMWPTLIDALERSGRYTCAGAIAGPIVEMDLRTFYLRDLTFTGATVVPPGVFADLVRYIERGEIKPLLAATYPFEELHAAQRAFIEKKHTGNIVLSMEST